jgi:glycosyltransferase involved in cell wall biosynthesis
MFNDFKLTIVFPCYNEGKKLKKNAITTMDYLKGIGLDNYEILIVNDGSNDGTLNYIIELKELYPDKIKVIHYKDNKGKGYAVKKGISEASGDYVLFMDADLSTDLSAIETCLTLAQSGENPIIIGSRRLKESQLVVPQSFGRKLVGTCCKIYTNMQLKLNLNDTQCGFKFFETSTAKKLVEKQTIDRWAFDAELLFIAKLNNIPIKEIPVKWENDEDSKVTVVDASIKFAKDLKKIKKNKASYIFQ